MKKNCELLFFQPNRVWRCYSGGKLLDKFMGNSNPKDDLFPENWLGSITLADNGEHSQSATEGLSQILSGEYFRDVLQADSQELLGCDDGKLGVLCKFLDSAIRLPLQCHPDKDFAKKYCNSNYGKTESWFILDTRVINGENPYILLGFKENVDKKLFQKAVESQNIEDLVNMMHKIEVKKGDAFFIPGRIPHAIGSGVLMLEVQEPTDLVVQPEEKIGDITLSFRDMWGNLTPEQGLECFNYQGFSKEEILSQLTINGKQITKELVSLIDEDLTDCFKVQQLILAAGDVFQFTFGKWQLAVVTSGYGKIEVAEKCYQIKQGDCFFVPNCCTDLKFSNSCSNDLLQLFLINT